MPRPKFKVAMSRKVNLAIFLNVLVVTLVYFTTFAQGPDAGPTPSADDVNNIARNMYCPVCENTPLDVCETRACSDWRDEIRLRLSQGWSDQQIYDYFVERFGERVLADPPLRGIGWLVYIVPPLIFAAGVVVVFRIMRSSITKPTEAAVVDKAAMPPDSLKPDDNKYAAELEEELKKRQ